MEELRRRQGSRISRANRPKAARPRRGRPVMEDSVSPGETMDQMIVDREEGSDSDDSELEKAVILKKRKSGTKSRMSNRKKTELEESLIISDENAKPHKKQKESSGGPKTSTPKNSPTGMIPVKESRMNLKWSPSKKTPDRKQNIPAKAPGPPAKSTSGSRRLSLKGPTGRPSPGQSPEKQGYSKCKEKPSSGVESKLPLTPKSGSKVKDMGKGAPYSTEANKSPGKSGRSVMPTKKIREADKVESSKNEPKHIEKETTPKRSRRSEFRHTDSETDSSDSKNKKREKSGSDGDEPYYVKKQPHGGTDRRRTSSFTRLYKKQVILLTVDHVPHSSRQERYQVTNFS